MTDDDSDAPGWDAITAAFERLYPGQEPVHSVGGLPPMLGGPLIQGISAYRATRQRPHWHFVTYGFSDLYEKEGDGEDSGYGFELTFRLARGEHETAPPSFAFNMLRNLGAYVARSGNGFAAGQYMHLNGPIEIGSSTEIVAALFAADEETGDPACEERGEIATPNGRLRFVQFVGVTLDECAAAEGWTPANLCALLREDAPALVTDLARRSILARAAMRRRVEEGQARDGSSCGLVFLDLVETETIGDGLAVTLGARGVQSMRRLLPLRLPFGRELTLLGPAQALRLRPGDADRAVGTEHGGEITLSPRGVAEMLATVSPQRGQYRLACCPGLAITVKPSETTDPDGTVTEVIG